RVRARADDDRDRRRAGRPRRAARARVADPRATHGVRRRALRALPAREAIRVPRRPGLLDRGAGPRPSTRGAVMTISQQPVPARPARVVEPQRPRVGVVKFASCDGCQLTILDLEDHLLALTDRFEFVELSEATSKRSSGPFDILSVEGSISTPEQPVEIVRLRAVTKTLVTIGACATAGGIQALRTAAEHEAFRSAVYPSPAFVDSLAVASPIASHVPVDFELRGCPIDARQLVELLTSVATGRRAQLPDQAVCLECKRRGYECVVVTR